jgi:hypothetical protein
MQWPQPLKEQLERIAAIRPIDDAVDEGRLNGLSSALARLDNELREQVQAITAAQVAPLISKLRADGPVGPADLELIRLWVVGDAEHYVKMEKDSRGWIAELDRLLEALGQLRTESMIPSTLGRMEATIRDALRVAGDIVFYRQEEERIRSFQNATRSLTREDKRMLADILEQKLSSEQI